MRLIAFLLAIAMPVFAHAQMPGPIQLTTDENFQACRAAGGTPSFGPGYLTAVELNGDGQVDYVTDLAAVSCEGVPGYFCGSAGCPVTVWLSGVNGPFVGWKSHVQGWELKDGKFVAVIHGAFCEPPRTGDEGCQRTITFAGVNAPAVEATQAAQSPAATGTGTGTGTWQLRQAEGAPTVAISPSVGNLVSLAGFCLEGHPLLMAVFSTKPAATKVDFEFRFPGGALTVPAESGAGTGGAYVMDAGASGLAAALSDASEVPILVDGQNYGVLPLAGSSISLRTALASCLKF